MKVRFVFAWYDLWVGVYWDQAHRRLFVMVLPTLGFVVDFGTTNDANTRTIT